MEMRELGHKDAKVAPLVLGGNVFGWTADKQTSFDILNAFLDGGFNAVDTANVYSRWIPGHKGGESETVIGEWLA
ncbi:MAG: aldo/keto reductase, partial [Henriciella sp.]